MVFRGGCRPALVFHQAVFRANEFLPYESRLEAILAALLNVANHILKVPGRPGTSRQLELEEAEADLVRLAVQLVKHQAEDHAVGGAAVVKRLGEPRAIVAP